MDPNQKTYWEMTLERWVAEAEAQRKEFVDPMALAFGKVKKAWGSRWDGLKGAEKILMVQRCASGQTGWEPSKEEIEEDEEDVEITNVQSPADRTAEAQRKAEAEGKVIDIDQDSGAEETKQDEDGNTIDHAQGNELGDMLEAQNLAEHLAAEDIFAAQRQALLELEGTIIECG